MARPTKYSDEAAAKILQALELGGTYELASRYGGISFDTFLRWRKRYAGFATQLKEVEANAAMRWLVAIQAAAERDWRAAAWMLEHRGSRGRRRRSPELRHPRAAISSQVQILRRRCQLCAVFSTFRYFAGEDDVRAPIRIEGPCLRVLNEQRIAQPFDHVPLAVSQADRSVYFATLIPRRVLRLQLLGKHRH